MRFLVHPVSYTHLGLAYTKELLELHKATIQCESELGKGSVFTVALPISEEAYPEEWLEYSEPKMEEVSLRESVPLERTNPVPENLRQTLLFVEDNEDLCRYCLLYTSLVEVPYGGLLAVGKPLVLAIGQPAKQHRLMLPLVGRTPQHEAVLHPDAHAADVEARLLERAAEVQSLGIRAVSYTHLSKQLEKLQAQAEEARLYEEKIHHLADQMIAIDLDDGVKVNYAKFADVLAKIK